MIELLRNVRWHLRKDFENSLSGFSLKRYRASLLMAIQDVTDELYKHEEHERHWCGGEFENERYIHPYQN